jgi:hypothetical protein
LQFQPSGHQRTIQRDEPLHQAGAEAFLGCLVGKYRGGQLTVIAGQDQTLGRTALCCLVQDLPGQLDSSYLFAADPAGSAQKV